ncbi:MAG: hypothetical protein ACXVBW_13550, partial [Bdellovibrionota bacterium]
MHRNASFAIATCAFLLLAMPVSGAEDNSTGYEKGGFFHRIGVGITASDYAYYDKTYHFKSNCPANALEDKTKSADLIKAICKVNGGWREGDFFSTALNGGKDVMDRMAELLWIKEAMQKRLPQMKDSDEYLADLETKLKVDPKAKGVFKNLKDDLMAMGHAGHMINRLERSHAGGYDIYPPNVLKAAGAYVEKPGDNHGQCFAPYKRPATAKWYQSMNDERAQYVKEQEARPEVKRCKEALMAYNQADGKKPGFKFNVKKDIDGEYEVVNELGKDVLVAEASRKSDLDDYRGQRELLLQKNPVLAADVFSGHGGWLEKMEVYEDGYKGAFHAHEMIQHDMRKYDRMSDQEREDELQKNFNQDMLKAIKEARESIKDRSDDYKRILKNDDNLSGLITVLKAPKDKRAQAVKDYVDHVNFTLNDADLIEELLMTADPASDPDLRVLRNAECRLQAFVFADKAGHEIRSWELNSAMILMTAGVGGMMAETGNAVLKGIASGMNAGFVIQDGFSIAEASKKCDVIRASIAGGGVKKDAKGVAHLVTTKDSSGKQLFEQFKECQDEEVSTAVMAGINLLAI